MSVALEMETLCSDPLPPASHKPSGPGDLRSAFLLPKEAVELPPGPKIPAQVEAPLQVCMARLFRGQLCRYRENYFIVSQK